MRLLVQCLIRVVGIFYLVKAVEKVATSIFQMMYYQQAYDMPLPDDGVNPWVIVVAVCLVYLMISVGLFLAAPLLAKLIVGGGDEKFDEEGKLDVAVVVSAAMLVGVWALVRMIDHFVEYLPTFKESGELKLSDESVFYFIADLVIVLGSVLMVRKMPVVMRWLRMRVE